jgi:hypothetical protein
MNASGRRGFAWLAELLSFLAHRQRLSSRRRPRLAASRHRSRRKIAPVLTGRPARGLPKGASEIGLTGEIERQRDVDQRPVPRREQGLGAFQPPCADITMRRLTDGSLEGPREMKLAEARNRRQTINPEIAFEIGLDIVEHACQPASIDGMSAALPDRHLFDALRWT